MAIAVGRGGSNAEIAAGLLLGVAAVQRHVSSVLLELGLNHRTQVALLAHDAGVA